MTPIKLSISNALDVYLDAISMNEYELCFKLLYVHELYKVICRLKWKKIILNCLLS